MPFAFIIMYILYDTVIPEVSRIVHVSYTYPMPASHFLDIF